MSEKNEIENILHECKKLGIINIEASGGLSLEFAKEAIQAVKDINLDFDAIAKQMNTERKEACK